MVLRRVPALGREVALAWLLLAPLAAHAGEGASVDASRIVLEEGAAAAEGEVVIRLGAETLTAARANLEGEVLVVEEGRLEREGGEVLTFDRATVHLDDPSALEVEGASFTTCGSCARPPWRVTARAARVVLEEEVALRGAVVRIFEIPLLPVPAATVPLARRSGLLAPKLGWGEDGPRASLPVYLTLGRQADVTLAPEVRLERGARLLSEARWATRAGTGEVDGAVGYDWLDKSWRGAATWDQSASQGLLRAATTGRLVGDAAYLDDYRDDLLSRSWPWTEGRALVGAGPLELAWDHIQPRPEGGDGRWEQWTAGMYRGALDAPGGLLVSGSVQGQLERYAPDPGADWSLTSHATADASRPTWLGPVRLTPRARGGLWSPYRSDAPTHTLGWARAEVEAALPAWRDTDAGLERLEPTVSVYRSFVSDPSLAGAWGVVPGLTWRRTSGARLAEVRARAPMVEGVTLVADGALRWGPVHGAAQVVTPVGPSDRDALAAVDLGWDPGPLSLAAGWILAVGVRVPGSDPVDLHQVRGGAAWTLPGRLSTLRVGASATWDLDGTAWVSRVGRLAWTHPTGCARIGVVGRLDADRQWPDLGLELGVR